MTDLHTHILPNMDDGAQNVALSLQMLRLEFAQGIDTVALTPHFYRSRESLADFLRRRQGVFDDLMALFSDMPEVEQANLPRIILGAEVAWVPNMVQIAGLAQLCYENSRFLLVEPPFVLWDDAFFNQLYDLINCAGIIPIIAHIDRYWRIQKRAQMERLFSLDIPIQLSAESLLHRSTRNRALQLIRDRKVQMLVSDAHNVTDRAPNMELAFELIRKRNGDCEHLACFDLSAI